MINEESIRRHYAMLRPSLDERGRRMFAASQARVLGHGGLAAVARATGIAPSTISRGIKELDAGPAVEPGSGRRRRLGGGRKQLSDKDPTLVEHLLRLVEPATLGDPEKQLYWVSKSLQKLAIALLGMGHKVSWQSVGRLLRKLGYSRQGNFKANEGHQHADRDAQFEHRDTSLSGHAATRNFGRHKKEGACW